jgi:hypothetical protein
MTADEEDDIPTVMLKGKGPRHTLRATLVKNRGNLETAASYIAAALQGEFRDSGLVIKGSIVVQASIVTERGISVTEDTLEVPLEIYIPNRR